ncbi:MAG: hypothetical protein QG667_2502, partial [Pseudomonadota bacterium]|nr:hypothetical protein [Pseudomonadota bacterium]
MSFACLQRPLHALLLLPLLASAAATAAAVPGFEQTRSSYRPSEALWLDRHGVLLHSA